MSPNSLPILFPAVAIAKPEAEYIKLQELY